MTFPKDKRCWKTWNGAHFSSHVQTYGSVLMDSSDMNWREVSVVPGRSGESPGRLG